MTIEPLALFPAGMVPARCYATRDLVIGESKMVKEAFQGTYKERLAAGLVQHRSGSRKARIHETFDAQGEEAAAKQAKRLGIAESSFKAWARDWRFLASQKPARKARKARRPAGAKARKARKSR